jgi:hypothetical protein
MSRSGLWYSIRRTNSWDWPGFGKVFESFSIEEGPKYDARLYEPRGKGPQTLLLFVEPFCFSGYRNPLLFVWHKSPTTGEIE